MPLVKDESGHPIIPAEYTHYVFVTNSWELEEVLRTGDISHGHITTSKMNGYADWTLVGFATATYTTLDQQEMKDNLVDSLRQQAKSIQAEAQMKCTEIEKKVQQLLAISYTPQGDFE